VISCGFGIRSKPAFFFGFNSVCWVSPIGGPVARYSPAAAKGSNTTGRKKKKRSHLKSFLNNQ
jgi:hypothetical protein